jgi:hypothetical protein
MSASVPLKQEVTEQLPWLFEELCFRLVEDDSDPTRFGNSFVTLEGPSLRVRFVRDRDQTSAEVASRSEPGKWWNLEHVCELIAGRNCEPGFELSAIAALLRDNLPGLMESLGPKFPETKRELDRRSEERKQALLRRLSQ